MNIEREEAHGVEEKTSFWNDLGALSRNLLLAQGYRIGE